jgi:hypothetical protein
VAEVRRLRALDARLSLVGAYVLGGSIVVSAVVAHVVLGW